MQRPPAAGQLTGLDGVVAHRGQAITAWLPGQQHASRLHIFLLYHRLAGGLWAVWRGSDRSAVQLGVGWRMGLGTAPSKDHIEEVQMSQHLYSCL